MSQGGGIKTTMKDLSDLKFQTALLLAVILFLSSKSQAASEEDLRHTVDTPMAYNKLGRIAREEVINTETGERTDADALGDQLDKIPQDKFTHSVSDTGQETVDRTTSQVDRTMDRMDRIERATSQEDKSEKNMKS